MNWLWLRFLLISSFRNMWRSPRRTLFNLGAIASSAAALVLFQSFVEGVKDAFRHNVITSSFGHYQVFAEGGQKPDPDRPFGYQITQYDEIKTAIEEKIGPLSMASRRQVFFSLITHNDRSLGGQGIGIDASEERNFLTLNKVEEGVHLAESGDDGIFMGFDLAGTLGAKIGSTVTVVVTTAQGSVNAMDFQVTGIFKSGVTEMDKNFFYVHQRVAETLLGTKGAERILLGFKNDNEMPIRDDMTNLFKEKFPGLEVVHWHKLAPFFFNTMGWLEAQIKVFRVIILLVSALSIINVFTISLLERIGEFGTLRAIGTYRSEVVSMIFTEAFLQAFFGTAMGILLSIISIKLFLTAGITMPPPPLMSAEFHVNFGVPIDGVITTSILCIAVAGSAGIFPAYKIAKINIVEALGRNV